MTKDHESSFSESVGRTKLLRSRPEPDLILFFGLCALIGSAFCIIGLCFLIWWIIDEWLDILSIIGLILLLMLPVVYTLYALDMLVWQVKGAETVSYDENGIVIHLKKLIDRETTIPWNSIVEVEKYKSPWWTYFRRSYLYDASLRIHYTSGNGMLNTIRFGLLLNEKQEDIIIDRIYELRDKFSKKWIITIVPSPFSR